MSCKVYHGREGESSGKGVPYLPNCHGYPELKAKLLDERNRNWMPQIEQFLKQDEDILVVVGAAHLVGKEGVIELLKARGYTLKQM